MKKYIILICCLSIFIGCKKNPAKNNPIKNIKLLSFSEFLETENPGSKKMEIFAGNKMQGSIVSISKRSREFSIMPDDEAILYVIQNTMTIDLPLGSQEIRPGEAIFLPAGVTFRISSKNEKTESKVMIVRSNTGKVDTVVETEK